MIIDFENKKFYANDKIYQEVISILKKKKINYLILKNDKNLDDLKGYGIAFEKYIKYKLNYSPYGIFDEINYQKYEKNINCLLDFNFEEMKINVKIKKIIVYSFDQKSNEEDVEQLFLKGQYLEEKNEYILKYYYLQYSVK